jgi:hypothetical protein
MSTLRQGRSREQERGQPVDLFAKSSPAVRQPAPQGMSTGALKRLPKPPLHEKKTRCVSFWIRESDYLKLLEMATDNTTMANIGRQALNHYLKRLQKKGRP